MPHDASRRWLEDSGLWSCRIKLPQQQINDSKVLKTPTAMMDSVNKIMEEPGSPSSRRNKDKIAEALHSMSQMNSHMEALELPTDPDAQATVTDFIDFTEFLPADMVRSLTLIGKLDQMYSDASVKLHEDVKTYGKLPDMPADQRPDDVQLRAVISQETQEVMSARYLAAAEANRFGDNIDRHVLRAENILAKLIKMREEYPAAPEEGIVLDAPELIRNKPTVPIQTNGMRKGRKQRPPPRITVPGEVLAPYERDFDWYDTDSDSGSDEDGARVKVGAAAAAVIPGIKTIKLKIVNKDKDKKKKKVVEQKETVIRPPRAPSAGMGTNVHSRVAGISTSNALRLCQPPPPGAVIGDIYLPWLQCNEWETANLRKDMKKNANWAPSDTMIARQLEKGGRGYENYKIAVAKALSEGKEPPAVPPQLRGISVNEPGALSIEYLKIKDNKSVNKGMKLNEAKKLKKESMAKQAAEEAAQLAAAADNMVNLKSDMENVFNGQGNKSKTLIKIPPKSASKKRKREDEPDETVKAPGTPATAIKPAFKRTKTETPIPVPQTLFSKQNSALNQAGSVLSTASPAPTFTSAAESTPELLAPPTLSVKKSSTPILPPAKKMAPKKEAPKTAEPPATTTRSKRSDDIVVASPAPTPAAEALPAKRPTSSRSKKPSEEPTVFITAAADRPQRTSTARNTPAPAVPEPHKMNRRAKRPPPGVLSNASDGEGSTAVSKRSKATRKKAGAAKKKEKSDREDSLNVDVVYEEVDDEGNPIDPNEPRYCVCNRVSFGTMIECDNKDCEKEWFHLECVELAGIPGKTTKWYCPDCRDAYNTAPNGEVAARGRKK